MSVLEWFFANFGKIWIASFVLGLALTGVLVWGFVSLVLHFT